MAPGLALESRGALCVGAGGIDRRSVHEIENETIRSSNETISDGRRKNPETPRGDSFFEQVAGSARK
jgi:hypothetical protein